MGARRTLRLDIELQGRYHPKHTRRLGLERGKLQIPAEELSSRSPFTPMIGCARLGEYRDWPAIYSKNPRTCERPDVIAFDCNVAKHQSLPLAFRAVRVHALVGIVRVASPRNT